MRMLWQEVGENLPFRGTQTQFIKLSDRLAVVFDFFFVNFFFAKISIIMPKVGEGPNLCQSKMSVEFIYPARVVLLSRYYFYFTLF